MNRFTKALAVPFLALTISALPMMAQEDHHDDHAQRQAVRHDDWKKGGRIAHDDWARGQRVDDWRAHHLRRPPRGYEWRSVDGHYVLANSNGVILEVHVF